MSTQNKSSFLRTLAISVIALGCAVGLFLPVATIVTHGHSVERGANNSGSRPHTATLRAIDSAEGSRVVLTADQSLNSYEAYRRGDRFYVKIPLSKVPRVDLLRGRAFTQVEVEQTAGGTIVSFRLQPGGTARVEQWPDRLEIVFVVSRTRTTSAGSRTTAPSGPRVAPRQTDVRRAVNSRPVMSKIGNASRSKAAVAMVANTGQRRPALSHRFSIAEGQDAAAIEREPATDSDSIAESQPEIAVDPSPIVPETNWAAATVTISAAPNSAWTNLKDRARYCLQVAQRNPIPFGIGAALVLFFLGVVILRRQRVDTPRADALLAEALQSSAMEIETETVVPSETIVSEATQGTRNFQREDRASGEPTTGGVIGKLVLDNAHRADIMSSRSPDDRKVIESSLMRMMMTAETGDEDRRRARHALEEYGFVAQHSASLLKGRDAWERACAARALGLIGSKTSMPFLIEALNDEDPIVRNQAVASLAALRDPTAIGALLEAARKHPDVPASLLSETLSACSVDSLGFLDLPSSEAALLTETPGPVNDDAQWFEDLRQDVTDEILPGWLALDSAHENVRTENVARPLVVRAVQERPYLRVVA